jgi:hypothetical protein
MIERTDNPNLAILEIAVEALGNLSDSLVFVGGCATGLLVTPRGRREPSSFTGSHRAAFRINTLSRTEIAREFRHLEWWAV